MAALINKHQTDQTKTFAELATDVKKLVGGLQLSMTSPSMLSLPHTVGHYIPDAGVCAAQVGWRLFKHETNGLNRKIGYWSRIFYDSKKNWWQRTNSASL